MSLLAVVFGLGLYTASLYEFYVWASAEVSAFGLGLGLWSLYGVVYILGDDKEEEKIVLLIFFDFLILLQLGILASAS